MLGHELSNVLYSLKKWNSECCMLSKPNHVPSEFSQQSVCRLVWLEKETQIITLYMYFI